MNTKRLKRGLLVGYPIVILFCMFLGFGRVSRFDSFQWSLAITGIPLWFPKHFALDTLRLWIFAMGNLVAFIPFGVLIPLNFQSSKGLFLKSLATFVAGIAVLETLQMLSLLGSFDAEDILVNTMGFLIGYASWSFGRAGKRFSNRILRFGLVCVILIAAALIGAQAVNSLVR